MTALTLEQLHTELARINQRLTNIEQRLTSIEQRLTNIDHRFPAIERRLQTFGTWLLVGLAVCYAVVFALTLRAVVH